MSDTYPRSTPPTPPAPRVPVPRVPVLVLVLTVLALVSCAVVTAPAAERWAGSTEAESLRVEVLATYPHDPGMYTQGLEIAHGMLYESSGKVGESRVRTMELSNSAPGPVLAEVSLPAPFFGEGVTVTDTRLWQLTWKDGVAFERDPFTLEQRRQVRYEGEGWGLCDMVNQVVMSDGSDRLTFRDPESFLPTGQVRIRLDGEPVTGLNELECVDGVVWANVYQTDLIVRIDPGTGTVTGVVSAAGLLEPPQRDAADVLNGIAAIPDSDEFFITGKYWPTLFRVRFVPVA